MREPTEVRSPPLGTTPKKLTKLSAEKFADILAVRALPVIELYFCEDELFHNSYFPCRSSVLDYLVHLKAWFWDESNPLLGPKESPIRLILNQALTDVLDYHSEVMKGPRDQQLFAILIFQIMFQYEAGKLTTRQNYFVDHLCKNLDVFLERMGPSALIGLYGTSLFFSEPHILATIVRYTPNLKFLKIDGVFDKEVLTSLRAHCPNIEEMELVLEAFEFGFKSSASKRFAYKLDGETLGDLFCKIFFGDLNIDQLLERTYRRQSVKLTFPYLKVFHLCCKKGFENQNLNHVMFFLQHFYSCIRVKWYHAFDEDFLMPRVVEDGTKCPAFVTLKNNFSWDNLLINKKKPNIKELPEDYCVCRTFLKVNRMCIHYDHLKTKAHNDFIDNLMRTFKCQNLYLRYSNVISKQLTQVFSDVCPFLKELFLNGPLFQRQDGEQLYLVLRQCVNLTVLCLVLDLVFNPKLKLLSDFTKLEVLSLKVSNYPFWGKFPIRNQCDQKKSMRCKRPTIKRFMKENQLTNDLPAYIQSYKSHKTDYSSHPTGIHHPAGRVRHPTGRVRHPAGRVRHPAGRVHSPAGGVHPPAGGVHPPAGGVHPPALKKSFGMSISQTIRHSLFGFGPLAYDVPDRSSNPFGFGVQEYKPLAPFYDICGHRIPAFAFYGHTNYGFRLHSSGFVGYTAYIYRGIENRQCNRLLHDHGSSDSRTSTPDYLGNRLYSHLRPDTVSYLLGNHDYAARENLLPQWRLDMDFDAPITLLVSLIVASPNLKVLEIPDLKVDDVPTFFNNPIVRQNISHVHTLHLSTQFSKILAMIVATWPSLRLVRVDPNYGTDNFLRFKRSLCRTSIVVESGNSCVNMWSRFLEKIHLES